MLETLVAVMALSCLGAVIGLLLGIADKKLSVTEDPRIDAVEAVLPSGQCGGCGFAGCRQYAEKVVSDPLVSPSLCTPGGNKVAEAVAGITGKTATACKASRAVVHCRGCENTGARTLFAYDGVQDCAAATRLLEGDKACKAGCLGLGTCAAACPYDAIEILDTGLAKVDPDRCVGCGVCVAACPRGVISLVPESAKSMILCANTDKGGETRQDCQAGCIGCRLCVKACPHGAVTVEANLSRIDYEICETCPEPLCLLTRCKPGVIRPFYGVAHPAPEETCA